MKCKRRPQTYLLLSLKNLGNWEKSASAKAQDKVKVAMILPKDGRQDRDSGIIGGGGVWPWLLMALGGNERL
jgi:hypothetical protein